MATKQKKNVSYNSIPDITEDWSLDKRNNMPYSGESVQEFIKNTFESKASVFYYDADTVKYLVFSSTENRDLYLSNREEYATLLLGSFDAPANYTAEINLITPVNNAILSGDKNNYIEFTFDVKNKSGASTGESVIATFSFNKGGNVRKVTQVYSAGEQVRFLADDYLTNGVTVVSIVIQGRNTLAAVMASITYTMINLELTSDFDFASPIEEGEYIDIPYTIKGSGVKYIEWYVDGVKLSVVDNISDVTYSTTKHIDTSELTTGKHNIQARPYTTLNGTEFYGRTLYWDVVVTPENEQWDISGIHLTYILLSMELSAPAINGITITGNQWEAINYKVGLYDYRRRELDLTIKDNNVAIQTISIAALDTEDKSYTPVTAGSHVLTFLAGEAVAAIEMTVTEIDLGIHEETEDLLLKLSAKGRNNNEQNPAQWSYGNINATFNNIAWNEQYGWINDALVIPAGGSVQIPFAALGNSPVTKGRTIEIDYEVADVENDDASVMNLSNVSTGAGLTLTATSAKLQSSGGAQVNTKYRDGDRIHLAFIINKVTGDDNKLIFIVNNGVLERAASFEATDNFNVADNITIGSQSCIVKIYSIRVYDKALTVEQAFGNFVMDSDRILDLVYTNDILNASTGRIDADKVNARIPVLIITGDMEPIFNATDKNATTYVDLEYKNLQDPTKNFIATHVRMRPQGTSSLGYPRKNLRPYTSAIYGCIMLDAEGNVIQDGKYSFKDGAQPVNCWTLKADYAESSGSHNTGIARLWNKLMYNAQVGNGFPLRTAAQIAAINAQYPYDVRTTVDGFPIVIFHRPNTESELTCLGQYNFNNDKSTESVFGFRDIPNFDNAHVQCFEVLGNEEPLALFTDISTFDAEWADAFESRYPDTKTPNLTPLKTLCTWVNACQNNQSKWNEEKEAHWDIPKLAAYYVYLMRFGAVDQTVKNSMLTTEDGVHWFFINYDNDTVIGIDNISTVLNAWDYDRTTRKTGGAYVYAGHESVLWNCFEADPDCMAMVRTIDNALYSAGLTYNNMLQMFDEEQCDKWCERIYNDNGRYKYIQPFKEKGAAVLYMLQGSRKSYRHWWLKNRMEMFDAKWATAAYTNRVVRFIAEGAPSGSQFTIGANKASYFGYGINAIIQEIGIGLDKDETHEFTIAQALAIGDPINIYNANNVSMVDLSEMTQYLTTLYLQQAVDNNGKSVLKQLILGDGTTQNVKFTEIGGMTTATALEEIDIRNFTAMTAINLEAQNNLHIFKASGSGLTSFAPAAGAQLTNVTLPATLQSLVLDNCNVTAFAIDVPAQGSSSNLTTLVFRNVSGTFDVKNFVLDWLDEFTDNQLANCSLTLTGINWTGVTVAQVLKLAQVGEHTLRGRIMLTSLTYDQYQQIIEAFGGNVFDPNGSFIIDAPNGIYFSAPASLTEGHTVTLNAVAFPIGANPIVYHLYDNGTEVNPVEGIATLGGVTLNVNTGELSVGTIDHNFTIGLRAVSGSSVSDLQTCSVQDITTIGDFTIQGTQTYTAPGNYELSLIPTNQNYNVAIQSIEVQAQSMSELFSFTYDTTNLKIGVSVSAIPATTKLQYCNIVVTDVLGNVFRQDNVELTIQVVRPTDFTISGAETILSKGTYHYNITDILPANHNKDIASIAVTVAPSQGVVISNPTSTGFNLVVTSMPECTTDIVLTVVATLDNNTTFTRTKTVKIKVVSNIDVLDELGVAIMHVDGSFYTLEQWQSEGFTNADANGVGVSNKTNRVIVNTPRILGSTQYDYQSAVNAIANVRFADGTQSRLPTKDEAVMCGLNYNDVSTYLEAIGMHYLYGSRAMNPYSTWTSTPNPNDSVLRYYLVNAHGLTTESQTYSGSLPVCTPKAVPLNKPVDLGLPSGRLWSHVNLGAASIEDTGLYYQWGNLDGHDGTDEYDFSSEHYAETPGSQITTRLPLANDAANDTLGGYWRTPTADDFAELFNTTYTTKVWTTVNGVDGWRITSKSNGNSIFMPVAGYIDETGFHNKTTNGYYWSADVYNSAGIGTILAFNGANATWNSGHGGRWGQPIRPVLDPPSLSGDSRISDGTHNYTIEHLNDIASISASVSTPSSGTISVTTSGTTTVALTITEAPSATQDVTLTVVATLTNGNTVTLTKTVTIVVVRLVMTSATNPEVLAICYAQGWCADSTKMTEEEATAVTSIGTAFRNNSQITHFEEFEYFTGVTSIGNNAFQSCTGLTSITIPSSVTSIGNNAFQSCTGLTSITIPNSVTNINIYTFSNCIRLESIELSNSITSIGNNTFYACSKLTSITIPSSVTSIGNSAFQNCTSLTSITIPNNVTSIGASAFQSCIGLTSITIPSGVTTISAGAFQSCTGLTSITIPSGVTSIKMMAFYGCSNLTSITISSSVTNIEGDVFTGCSSIISIEVDSNNTVYDSRNNCNAIIKTASNTLILGCKNTIIPNDVTTIDYAAFQSCTGLTSITIPSSVTSIGNNAFQSCTGLTSITIPSSVTAIGAGAFNGCSNLESINIPNGVTTIGSSAFYGCSKLTSITIPSSVTNISAYSFQSCTGLTSITIPNGVTTINVSAFQSCSKLTSITIPSSVTSINYNAFESCRKLSTIDCLSSTAPSVQYNTFNNIATDPSVTTKTLNVPAGATGYDTGYWKTQLIDEGFTLNATL